MASVTALPRAVLPQRGARTVVALILLLALAVGALSTVQPLFGVALIGAAVVGVVVAYNIASLPYFLVFTMFIESVSLGPGLRIGRVFGGMALLVLALTLLTRGKAGLRPTALLTAAGAYGLWIFASMLWAWSPSAVPGIAFSYFLAACYALTFAVLVRRREQLFMIAKVLAVGSAVFGAVAFVYYLQHIGTASSANDIGSRAAGLQGDPNYFAIFQVIAMPPALVLAATQTRRSLRLMYYAVVGVIVISVVSSLSRTGLIALTIAVLLTLALPWRIFFSAAGQKGTYLLAIIAGAGAAGAMGSTALVARVQTILDPNAAGSYRGAGRTDLWAAALHGWHRSNELIGLGAGNFRVYSLDFLQATPGVDTTQNYVRPFREVHNAYLENLTDLGAIGLALFIAVLFFTGRALVHSFRRARAAGDLDLQRFSLAFLVSLVGYTLSAFFLSNQLAKALWIIVGLALALEVMTRRLPAAVPAVAETYDGGVPRTDIDDLMRRLLTQQQQLVADQERIDRRRAALDERERELAQRAAAPPPELQELERRLTSEQERLAAEQAKVEERRAAVEDRARELEQRAATPPRELVEREQRVEALQERLASEQAKVEERRAALEQQARELEERRATPPPELVEREQRVEALQERLAAEQAKVEERRAALEARARELEEITAKPPAPDLTPQIRALEKLLASRDRTIERLHADAESSEDRLARLERLLAEREASAAAAAAAPPPVAAPERPVEPPARVEPTAPVTPPPGVEEPVEPERVEIAAAAARPGPFAPIELEPHLGRWSLPALESAMARYPNDPHHEEWQTYAVFLRDHAELDGLLPVTFDALVDEVFGDLISRVRAGA